MYALPNTRGGHTQHREKYKTTKKIIMMIMPSLDKMIAKELV